MGRDHVGRGSDQCDWGEFFLFPGQLGKHRGVAHVVSRVRDQERIAVLGCPGHQGIRDIAARAPFIFNDHLLTEQFAQGLANEPG